MLVPQVSRVYRAAQVGSTIVDTFIPASRLRSHAIYHRFRKSCQFTKSRSATSDSRHSTRLQCSYLFEHTSLMCHYRAPRFSNTCRSSLVACMGLQGQRPTDVATPNCRQRCGRQDDTPRFQRQYQSNRAMPARPNRSPDVAPDTSESRFDRRTYPHQATPAMMVKKHPGSASHLGLLTIMVIKILGRQGTLIFVDRTLVGRHWQRHPYRHVLHPRFCQACRTTRALNSSRSRMDSTPASGHASAAAYS